jgi:hypothetical protein
MGVNARAETPSSTEAFLRREHPAVHTSTIDTTAQHIFLINDHPASKNEEVSPTLSLKGRFGRASRWLDLADLPGKLHNDFLCRLFLPVASQS